MISEERITEIVRGIVATSDRPIGMVAYGVLVARAIEAEVRRLCSENAMLRTGDTCARQCEGAAYRIELRRLKRDVLAVMPENWREDEEWARLIEAHGLTPNAIAQGRDSDRPSEAMDLQTMENEVLAWRQRFPQYEYRAQDDCVALKFDHAYGCHCDLEPGMKPDKCVLDEGRSWDCKKALQLLRDGKGRNDCDEWKPIELHSAEVS